MDQIEAELRPAASSAEVKFIRLKEVLDICGKSKSSVYEAIKRGEFPAPVKLQGRSSGWIKSEIQQLWTNNKVCHKLSYDTDRNLPHTPQIKFDTSVQSNCLCRRPCNNKV